MVPGAHAPGYVNIAPPGLITLTFGSRGEPLGRVDASDRSVKARISGRVPREEPPSPLCARKIGPTGSSELPTIVKMAPPPHTTLREHLGVLGCIGKALAGRLRPSTTRVVCIPRAGPKRTCLRLSQPSRAPQRFRPQDDHMCDEHAGAPPGATAMMEP